MVIGKKQKTKILYELVYNSNMKVSIVKGNRKLGKGIYSFNTIPGGEQTYIKSRDAIITNVAGTCTGVCDGCEQECYAVRDYKLHHNAIVKSAGINTLLIRYHLEDAKNQIIDFLKTHKGCQEFRWHSSGEIESLQQLVMMNEIAKTFPKIKFGTYTKRFNILEEFCQKYGLVASNFTINLSVWRDNYKGYDFGENKFNQFVWDDGQEGTEVSSMIHCPAVLAPVKAGGKGHRNKNITCTQCGRCYKGNRGLKTAVYDH